MKKFVGTKRYRVGDRPRISYKEPGAKSKPERISVTIIATIKGGDLVAVDSSGHVYTTWWDKRARKCKTRKPVYFRHWRRFRHGIHFLERSLIHALVDVNLEKIPTVEELKNFCQQKHAELMMLDRPTAGWVGKIANQFNELQMFLENKTSPDLVDAKTQLHFFLLLRDSMGRLNIGVLCCRLATVNNRFRDELKHILGWTPHYAARLAAVQGLQRQFARNVREIQRTVSALVGHKAFVEGKTTSNQIIGIKANLQIQINKIDLLKEVRPFCRWAKHCINDLDQAKTFVEQKKFTEAKEVLEKLIQSIQLRMLGFELEELIKEFSLSLVKRQIRVEEINTKIGSLAAQFKQIDDSNFSQPVCQTILERLEEARTNLLFGNFAKAKDFLKSAVAPI